MSITNGQSANQTNFNAAFLSRTSNTSTVGKVDLSNTATESGSALVNIQRELNSMSSFSGKAINVAKDNKPAWTENNIGASGDSLFAKINSIDVHLGDGVLVTTAGQSFSGAKIFSDTLRASGDFNANQKIFLGQENNTQTGASAYIIQPDRGMVRLTASGFVSLAGIAYDGTEDSQIFVLTNATSNTITILNDSASASGLDIYTGTGDNIFLTNNASVLMYRDTSILKWRVVGGTGSGITEDIIAATYDVFSGDNSDVTFTLSVDPVSEDNIDVYISGVYQFKSTYSVSGTTLTFSEAPPVGTSNIEVAIRRTIPLYVLPAGSVGASQLATGSVTDIKRTINYTISGSDSGSFSGSSTSATDVTNVTATITASGTKPIRIKMIPSSGGNAYVGIYKASGTAVGGSVLCVKDGGTAFITDIYLTGATGALEKWDSPSAFEWIDPSPSAGSHTYKVQYQALSGSTMKFGYCKLMVEEI